MDAVIDAEDEIANVLFAETNEEAVNSPTGFIGTGGLITQFTFVPVPEPSAGLLLGAGMLALAAQGRRARRLPLASPSGPP